jgi:hypothetical protein
VVVETGDKRLLHCVRGPLLGFFAGLLLIELFMKSRFGESLAFCTGSHSSGLSRDLSHLGLASARLQSST